MISDKWKALGRRLGFGESELIGFHKNNEEYEEKGYAMLLVWKQRRPESHSQNFKGGIVPSPCASQKNFVTLTKDAVSRHF